MLNLGDDQVPEDEKFAPDGSYVPRYSLFSSPMVMKCVNIMMCLEYFSSIPMGTFCQTSWTARGIPSLNITTTLPTLCSTRWLKCRNLPRVGTRRPKMNCDWLIDEIIWLWKLWSVIIGHYWFENDWFYSPLISILRIVSTLQCIYLLCMLFCLSFNLCLLKFHPNLFCFRATLSKAIK